MKAHLKNYRQSPRKVRLVADVVRGKGVDQVLATLLFLPKNAAAPIKKLIESAVANAKDTRSLTSADLYIRSIQVDEGIKFKRYRARARGKAAPIIKRTSRISVELGQQSVTDNKQQTATVNKEK